jgi:Iml2/Tetratricopeptide repeat protein 39
VHFLFLEFDCYEKKKKKKKEFSKFRLLMSSSVSEPALNSSSSKWIDDVDDEDESLSEKPTSGSVSLADIDDKLVSILERARKALHACKLREAEAILESGIGKCALRSTMHAEVSVWRAMFADDDAVYNEAFERLQRAKSLANSLVELSESSVFSSELRDRYNALERDHRIRLSLAGHLSCAEIQLFRAGIHFKSVNYVRGALFVRRAWKSYEAADKLRQQLLEQRRVASAKKSKAAAASSSSSDARVVTVLPKHVGSRALYGGVSFGIGVFHFLVSQVPPAFMWLAKALGFVADRANGIKQLQLCSRTPSHRALLASLAEAMIEGFFNDDVPGAIAKLSALRERDELRDAVLLTTCLAYEHRLSGALQRSTELLREAQMCVEQLPQWTLTLTYEIAHNAWLSGDFERAAPMIATYMDESELLAYKPMGAYKLGLCWWITQGPGAAERIAALYARVPTFVRPRISYDAYALRKTKEFLAAGSQFSAFDAAFVLASNLHEGMLFERALEALGAVKPIIAAEGKADKSRIEHYALYTYMRGAVLKELGQRRKAETSLRECMRIMSKVRRERWACVFATIVLADLLIDNAAAADNASDTKPLLKEAKSLLSKAKSASDCDFENLVPARVSRTTEKLIRHLKSKKN